MTPDHQREQPISRLIMTDKAWGKIQYQRWKELMDKGLYEAAYKTAHQVSQVLGKYKPSERPEIDSSPLEWWDRYYQALRPYSDQQIASVAERLDEVFIDLNSPQLKIDPEQDPKKAEVLESSLAEMRTLFDLWTKWPGNYDQAEGQDALILSVYETYVRLSIMTGRTQEAINNTIEYIKDLQRPLKNILYDLLKGIVQEIDPSMRGSIPELSRYEDPIDLI